MNIAEIKKLLEMFDSSNSVKLKITNENFEITLEKSSPKSPKIIAPTPVAPIIEPKAQIVEKAAETSTETSQPSKKGDKITSPMVGTFYRAPSPDSAPYVNVGDKVKKGQTIGIIEAMKIMNEIEAEFDCKILEIIASDAKSVEFGADLFIVEKI